MYNQYSRKVSKNNVMGNSTINMKKLKDEIATPIEKIESFLVTFSLRENLKTASFISNDNIGSNRLNVVKTKSTEPYSAVESLVVYTGTRIKLISLDAKLPTVIYPMFLSK